MNYYETRKYTDEELLVRILDKEEIKNLMARRAFYRANQQRRRELDELWVATEEYRKSASYGLLCGPRLHPELLRDGV